MAGVMCIRLEFIWGLHSKGRDRLLITSVVQHFGWQVYLILDAKGSLYVESILPYDISHKSETKQQ